MKVAILGLLTAGLAALMCPASAHAVGCDRADRYAKAVSSSSPTSSGLLAPDILGPPDARYVAFDDDGSKPAFVVVDLDDVPIADGDGADVAVHLTDFFTGEDFERFEVLVSSTPDADFVSLGTRAPSQPATNVPERLDFDLHDAGVGAARYVMIRNVDVLTSSQFEGPDLDAVESLTCTKPPPPLPPPPVVPPPAPPPPPPPLDPPPCSDRRVVLEDVFIDRGRVRLLGVADRAFAGQRATIVFAASRKTVAQALVAADGRFSATAALPPRRIRNSNRARYEARIGGERSLALKLVRRLQVTSISAAGGRVTIAGRVLPPFARGADRRITVQRRVTCATSATVGTVTPRADGRFNVTVDAPNGASSAVYRLRTKVRRSARSTKLFNTFTLPRAVNL